MSTPDSHPHFSFPEDNAVYVINPFFRLRDSLDHVVVFGAQGIGTWRLHYAHAVCIALCDGSRTVADIARITSPFARPSARQTQYDQALGHVKWLFYWMSKSREEQRGRDTPLMFPSHAPIIQKTKFEEKFAGITYFKLAYDPYQFVPDESRSIPDPPYDITHDFIAPHTLPWHLTSQCSTECKYCYLRRRDIAPMPKSRALEIVTEAAEMGVLSIEPLGGDVLLYPYLVDILSEIHQRKMMPVTLSTKSFVSPELANWLSKFLELIWELQFSIDTDDEQIAGYLVGSRGYPKRMFASIENSLSAGLRVGVKAVATPYNVLTIPRLCRTLIGAGVRVMRIAIYSRSGFHHTDDLFLSPEAHSWLDKEVSALKEAFPDCTISLQGGAPTYMPLTRELRKNAWPERSACTAGRTAMLVCADGRVIPCEQMPETDEYFCGDVSIQTIEEVWNGERLKHLTYGIPRERFRNQPCFDCEEREECHGKMGYCIRDLATMYGNIYQPPPNCFRHDLAFIRQV